jgi:hypothetical protein
LLHRVASYRADAPQMWGESPNRLLNFTVLR